MDAILNDLDEMGQHLTVDSIPLAKAAFQQVFERITLYWEHVSPRRKELVRAEITPRFPFSLTTNTLIRASNRRRNSVHPYASMNAGENLDNNYRRIA